MTMKHIKIEDATPEQRADYVRTFLNLPLDGHETDIDIQAKIAAAQPGATMMFVNEADSPAEIAQAEAAIGEVALKLEEAPGKLSGSLGKGDPRAIIMIPVVESEDGSGAGDVLVGVNGRGWQLKRGFDLPVPWRVVEALQNAVADIVRHRSDEGHEGDVTINKARRFNFQFVERPPQAEIDAWVIESGKQFCA